MSPDGRRGRATIAAMRTLKQLIERKEPGIELVQDWATEATNPVEFLPVERADGEWTLVVLQITSRSPMGALALETGGLLVDHGWLRVLGGGGRRMPRSLTTWNHLDDPEGQHRLPGACLVGDDVIGGFFAIDGGGLTGTEGNLHYFAPETLEWEDMEVGYSHWLRWTMTGDLADFYGEYRWPGWERDVARLSPDRSYSLYPFPCAEGPPLAERDRSDVPVEELWQLYAFDLPGQLGLE